MTSAPITTSDLAQRAQDDKLSLREKIGYGLGDAGGTVITCLIMNFLTFFYTDVFGLTPALVGTLFLALRVFDAVSDPNHPEHDEMLDWCGGSFDPTAFDAQPVNAFLRYIKL